MNNPIFIVALCVLGCFLVNGHTTIKLVPKELYLDSDIIDCLAETGVERSAFEVFVSGQDIAITKELDCTAACLMKKKGHMHPNGTVIINSNDSPATKACKQLGGTGECHGAGTIAQCTFAQYYPVKIDS